jgi:hypothetical protein
VLIAQIVSARIAVVTHAVVQAALQGLGLIGRRAPGFVPATTIHAAGVQRTGITIVATRPIQTAAHAVWAIGLIGAAATHA